MTAPLSDAAADARRLRRSFAASLGFAAALWLIELAELALHLDFTRYGVYP